MVDDDVIVRVVVMSPSASIIIPIRYLGGNYDLLLVRPALTSFISSSDTYIGPPLL